ncbi:MAG: hypothetical protein Q9227_003575 [Pyrenula ochraceoflavens]
MVRGFCLFVRNISKSNQPKLPTEDTTHEASGIAPLQFNNNVLTVVGKTNEGRLDLFPALLRWWKGSKTDKEPQSSNRQNDTPPSSRIVNNDMPPPPKLVRSVKDLTQDAQTKEKKDPDPLPIHIGTNSLPYQRRSFDAGFYDDGEQTGPVDKRSATDLIRWQSRLDTRSPTLGASTAPELGLVSTSTRLDLDPEPAPDLHPTAPALPTYQKRLQAIPTLSRDPDYPTSLSAPNQFQLRLHAAPNFPAYEQYRETVPTNGRVKPSDHSFRIAVPSNDRQTAIAGENGQIYPKSIPTFRRQEIAVTDDDQIPNTTRRGGKSTLRRPDIPATGDDSIPDITERNKIPTLRREQAPATGDDHIPSRTTTTGIPTLRRQQVPVTDDDYVVNMPNQTTIPTLKRKDAPTTGDDRRPKARISYAEPEFHQDGDSIDSSYRYSSQTTESHQPVASEQHLSIDMHPFASHGRSGEPSDNQRSKESYHGNLPPIASDQGMSLPQSAPRAMNTPAQPAGRTTNSSAHNSGRRTNNPPSSLPVAARKGDDGFGFTIERVWITNPKGSEPANHTGFLFKIFGRAEFSPNTTILSRGAGVDAFALWNGARLDAKAGGWIRWKINELKNADSARWGSRKCRQNISALELKASLTDCFRLPGKK